MAAVSEEGMVSHGPGQQYNLSRDLDVDHRKAVGLPKKALMTRVWEQE